MGFERNGWDEGCVFLGGVTCLRTTSCGIEYGYTLSLTQCPAEM